MFRSKDDAYVNPLISIIVYYILGAGNGFLKIISFSFVKLDKNITVPLFSSWIKVGSLHSDIFNF